MQHCIASLATGFVLLITVFCGHSDAEQLAQLKVSGLEIRLNTIERGYELLIKPVGGIDSLSQDLTANVFAIESPTRLVVDIPDFSSNTARTINLTDNFFRALRLGVHSDKVRLVLDVIGDSAPEYSISSDTAREAIVVLFNPRLSAPFQEKRVETHQETNIPELSPELYTEEQIETGTLNQTTQGYKVPDEKLQHKPSATAPKEPSDFEQADQGLSQAMAAVGRGHTARDDGRDHAEEIEKAETPQSTTPSDGKVLVKGIYYHVAKQNNASAVMIDVDNLDMYQLSQKEPNRYELLLKNAKLAGSHLTLPQFPPDTFTGFEVILARPQGQDVVISIYVDQNVHQLSPSKIKDKLWLRAVTSK